MIAAHPVAAFLIVAAVVVAILTKGRLAHDKLPQEEECASEDFSSGATQK